MWLARPAKMMRWPGRLSVPQSRRTPVSLAVARYRWWQRETRSMSPPVAWKQPPRSGRPLARAAAKMYFCDGAGQRTSADGFDVELDLRPALDAANITFRNLGE